MADKELPVDRKGFVHMKLPGSKTRGKTMYTRVRPSSVPVWEVDGWTVVENDSREPESLDLVDQHSAQADGAV